MSNHDLTALLSKARLANGAVGVTGILFYGAGQFAQVLEGEKHVVENLYTKISADPRHAGLVKLADKDILQRAFGEWSMAYEPVSEQVFEAVTGYVAPTRIPDTPAHLSAADALLYELIRSVVQL